MPLILDVFAPPFGPGDPRRGRAVGALEQAWAVHLVCDLDEDGRPIRHDADREAYLASNTRGGLPFLTTPDDEESATIGGLLEPDVFAPGGVEELHVLASVPSRSAPTLSRGLELVADALAASWAMLTPEPAHGAIVQQVIAVNSDDKPPAGLPRLDLAEFLAVDTPRRLGWISYWSDRVAARLGFTGNAESFASVQRVATGWIVQLTVEPLDLERADHMAALGNAYERFPLIGRAALK